jgi:hypothetical protein
MRRHEWRTIGDMLTAALKLRLTAATSAILAVDNPEPVKPLSKAHGLRYHQQIGSCGGSRSWSYANFGIETLADFPPLSGEIPAIRATFWRHAVAVFGADTALPMGVTVRSGPRALSER